MQSGYSQSSLADSFKLSVCFFNGGKNQCITTGTLTTLVVVLDLPQFLNTLNRANLSFHRTQQRTESVAPRQFSAHLWAAPCAKLPTRLTRLRSCLARSFSCGFFSCSFLHPCTSINPTLHHLWICFHSKTLQGCIHFAPVVWPIPSFSIVGLVLRPSLFGHKLEPLMVVPHVLFVVHKSGGGSVCQFACFFFQDIELLFHKFSVFLARSSFDLWHRPFDPLGSASPPQSCPIFQITFCHVLRTEGEHKESQNGERETQWYYDKPSPVDVVRAVCVTHTSHSITGNTPLLPNLVQNNQPRHSPWLILVHQLTPSVMLKNTPTKETLFRPWWPLHHWLHSFLLMTCFVLCHQISLANRRREKGRRNMRITKEMKRGRKWFFTVKIWFWRISDAKKSKKKEKTIGEEQEGQRKTLNEKRWGDEERGEKRREMGWCYECPAAEINDNWMHIDSLNKVTRRSNGQESLQSCARSSTHGDIEMRFLKQKFVENSNDNFERIFFCSKNISLLPTKFTRKSLF